MVAMNGDSITYLHHSVDPNLERLFVRRAMAEVESLRRNHGIRGTAEDVARVFSQEGGLMNVVRGGRGHVFFHIPCRMGGLGNAAGYTLVMGENSFVSGRWSFEGFGRGEYEGDILLRAVVTPSEKRELLEVFAGTTYRPSMDRRRTASDNQQGAHRRPGMHNTARYTSEDDDQEEEAEGNDLLDDRDRRAPRPGARNSTRQAGNQGANKRNRQPNARGRQRNVRDESPEPRPRRGEQRQTNPHRESENGRFRITASTNSRGPIVEDVDDRRGEQRQTNPRRRVESGRSRGTASAENRGPNLEDVDDPHPGWRDIPEEGVSGGVSPPPPYQLIAPDAAGGGGRRGPGGRRR